MALNAVVDEENDAIDIDMGEHHISYSYIETDSLSTCLGILIDGIIEDKKFCYLWHTPELDEEHDDDICDLLIYLLKKIVDHLKEDLKMNSLSSQPNIIKNLTLLIAGDAIDEHLLTRQAYALLNQNIDIDLTEESKKNIDVIHLFKELQNNVIIIPPVTYVLSDDVEDEGK